MKISILLVDDHRLLLDGLKVSLNSKRDWDVIDIASNGLEAIKFAKKLKPDIVILDISMPEMNGIEAARRIKVDSPKTKIIMLSMHLDRRFITESLKAGARGYILKDSAFQEVVEAITEVLKGELFFSRKIHDMVMTDYIRLIKESDAPPFSDLSAREKEVLQMIAEGNTTKEIASALFVSVKTIESHRKRVMDKLNIHSIAGLTKYAIREGITQLE